MYDRGHILVHDTSSVRQPLDDGRQCLCQRDREVRVRRVQQLQGVPDKPSRAGDTSIRFHEPSPDCARIFARPGDSPMSPRQGILGRAPRAAAGSRLGTCLMSSASRAMTRLRKECRIVLAHMRETNSRLGSSSCGVPMPPPPCRFEPLEPRLLLDASRPQIVAQWPVSCAPPPPPCVGRAHICSCLMTSRPLAFQHPPNRLSRCWHPALPAR